MNFPPHSLKLLSRLLLLGQNLQRTISLDGILFLWVKTFFLLTCFLTRRSKPRWQPNVSLRNPFRALAWLDFLGGYENSFLFSLHHFHFGNQICIYACTQQTLTRQRCRCRRHFRIGNIFKVRRRSSVSPGDLLFVKSCRRRYGYDCKIRINEVNAFLNSW